MLLFSFSEHVTGNLQITNYDDGMFLLPLVGRQQTDVIASGSN